MGKKPAYRLVWTTTFERTAVKFLKKHHELVETFEKTLMRLEDDPHDPKLRLHALQGQHAGKHAVRLTYEYRIVLVLKITAKEIFLLDVGSHDDVYQ